MEGRNYWIFQYTHDTRVDRLLRSDHAGDDVPWPWNERGPEPQPGDPVFFLRCGERPPARDYPRDKPWRGIAGLGSAAGPPVDLEGALSPRGIPVATLAFSWLNPLPDWRVWHDHRVADTSVLFDQQGTNFAITAPAAQALIDAIGIYGPPNLQSAAKRSLPDKISPEQRDALTELIERQSAWVNNHVAHSLHAARTINDGSSRPAELALAHLLTGLAVVGRDLPSDAVTRALAVVLYDLAVPEGDTTRFRRLMLRLSSRAVEPGDIDRRRAEPVQYLTPHANDVFRDAKDYSGKNPITVDALLAALLSSPETDKACDVLFASDRATLIDRIIEGGRERCPPADLEHFARSLGLSVPEGATSARDKVSPEEAGSSSGENGSPSEGSAPPPPPYEPPLGDGIAGTLNDTIDHGKDFLDVGHEAKAFARLIASKSFEPPLAIGIFGQWGTGKSFFIDRIDKGLQEIENLFKPEDLPKTTLEDAENAEKIFHRNIVQIHFNAWHYMETNVWASLVDVIFRDLDGWLRKEIAEKNTGDEIEALFESLATAQAERLEAIETYADRLRDVETARWTLQSAGKAEADHWTTIAREIIAQPEVGAAFDDVVDAFGLEQLSGEGAKLQAAIEETRHTASDARLFWTSLRARAASPILLVLLTVLMLGLPLLLVWLLQEAAVAPTVSALTGLATAAAAWFSTIALRTKTVVGALRQLRAAFDAVEHQRAQKRKRTLADCETRINEARTALAHAEQASAVARRTLHAGSAAGRVAAFIRSRAEGDTYARHLGIIDTIRRDFEQLTTLMKETDKRAEKENKILENQQKDLDRRIGALRARYLGDHASKAERALFAPIGEALDRVEKTKKSENPLNISVDRIVLFVDDLDRCPPDKVYRVLQAIHLFLNFRLFVVVVGVDTRWMETSLIRELGDLVNGTRGTTAQDYLEKIFQIPYWTRRMDATASRGFVKGVLDKIPAEASITAPPTSTEPGSGPPPDDSRPPPDLSSDAEMETSTQTVDEPARTDRAVQPKDPLATQEDLGAGQPNPEVQTQSNLPNGQNQTPMATRPVVITQRERLMIQRLAPQAGRSPRQLLRFVNVYGLIKSVTDAGGAPLLDLENDPTTCQALLAQLAIATGSPVSARLYFDALAKCTGNLSRFRNLIESSRSSSAVPEGETNNVYAVLRVAFAGAGRHDDTTDEKGFWPDADDDSARDFLIKLQETAPIARRYTFAAIDAVLALPTPKEAPDGGRAGA